MKPVSFLRAALAVGMTLGAGTQAFALTAAGTSVVNTATVDYKVGTVDQTTVPSNPSSFTVDRLIDVSVTAQNSPLGVLPGADDNVLKFKVTNLSNDTLDFDVSVVEAASTTNVGVGTDSFNMAAFDYFVDVNGNGTYESATDTATSIDDLAAGNEIMVFAVAKAPDTGTNATYAGVEVLLTAKDSTGAALVNSDNTTANTAGMDTVFGDADGPLAADGAKDAKISVYGAYRFDTATIAVIKSATIVSDPVNGTSNPKAIPGAVIEYCLVVTNTGPVAASGIALSDNLPAEMEYDLLNPSIRINSTGTSTTCDVGTGTLMGDDAFIVDGDEAEFTAGGTNGTGIVTIRSPSSLAATTGVFRAVFRAVVK